MDDLDRLSSDFEKARTATKRAVSKVVLDYGEKVADSARQLVPVDTGDLRDSIFVTGASKTVKDSEGNKAKALLSAAAGDLRVDVVAQDWKAGFIERGTVKKAPRPFLSPAFDQHVEGFVTEVLEIAGDSLW